MSGLSVLFILSCMLALALAEPRIQQQQRSALGGQRVGLSASQHPYFFLGLPRGRANAGAVVQGFEIVEQNDDDDDFLNEDDDDDSDDDEEESTQKDDDGEDSSDGDGSLDDIPVLPKSRRPQPVNGERLTRTATNQADTAAGVQQLQQVVKAAKPTHMMVARDQAGAIMVPDGIIEIEGQSVVDEKTGKSALLVPRAALDAIPDGSVVALMERATARAVGEGEEEERANRVIVRRRRTGGRRKVRRRRTGGIRRRPGGGKRRRRGNKRRNVRVIRPTRRRGNGRRRRTGGVRPIVVG
ncbi:SAGA-associated factor 73 [Scaptodrosophila lebanonensis]|uniref:SAGA-associated factor 73 n=1 Tax=Drosophila lebanonensis TaxID=7225 RepID=A0A6J2UDX4_DROLE|nr:SAGA-associated factor 73 [Scaptodrosophila lebanonensis]